MMRKGLPIPWLSCGLIFLTLLLRLPLLNGSFWLDEAAQILESSRPFSQQLQIRDDFQPPLLHLLTFITRHISTSEWWLRTWGALVPSLVVTWVMLQLLGEWWPKATLAYRQKALWLGLLLATNSLWVFYSQELRPYSLAVMWTALSWWLVVKIISQPKTKYWGWWIFAVLGGLYSTYLFPFVLISQCLYLMWQAWLQPKLWKGLILASFAVGLGCAPWVPSFFGQLQAGQNLRVDLPGWDQVVSTGQLKSLPLAMGKFLFGVVDLDLNIWYGSVAVIVSGLFAWAIWQGRAQHATGASRTIPRSALILLGWWVIVPVVLAWIFSFKIPVIQPKRILFVLPALYSLGIIAVTELKVTLAKWVGQLALVSLLLINIWSLTEYYRQPTYQRENWRQLHAQLQAWYPPQQTLAVFTFPEPFAGWRWYDQNAYAQLSLGYLAQPNSVDVTDKLKAIGDTYKYVFVFEYLESLSDPHRTVKAALQSLGWREIHAVSQPNIGFVRIYAKPNNLLSLNATSLLNL